jgi:YfiR/HmsC-like
VKAAMLFNFAKFVEWPESAFDNPQASIVFGIIGDQRLGFDLQRVASGEKVQGRSIVIRNMRFGDDLRGCHILLVGASERQHTTQILAGLQAVHVLTVSEIDGFADAGGAVEIVMEGDQARFVVNLDVARQRNLRVSAKVLSMARVINLNQAAK